MKPVVAFLFGVIVASVICALLGVAVRKCSSDKDSFKIDSVTVYDTLIYRKPFPVDSVIIRYVTEKLPVVTTEKDTIIISTTDSVIVKVPITQKEYKDSTYHAWVSGYMPNLDSIHVFRPTTTIRVIQKEKAKKWGLGIQAGAGTLGKSVQPYIGVGIQYNIISW